MKYRVGSGGIPRALGACPEEGVAEQGLGR